MFHELIWQSYSFLLSLFLEHLLRFFHGWLEALHLQQLPVCSKLPSFWFQVSQQLPEYGVLLHQVLPAKTGLGGDMALGICAKGLIIYEMKNHRRIATLRLQWREIGKISTYVSVVQLKNGQCFIFL